MNKTNEELKQEFETLKSKFLELSDDELNSVNGGQDSMLEAIAKSLVEAGKAWKQGIANVKDGFTKMFRDIIEEQQAKNPGFKDEFLILLNKMEDKNIDSNELWLLAQEFMNKYLN